MKPATKFKYVHPCSDDSTLVCDVCNDEGMEELGLMTPDEAAAYPGAVKVSA